MLLEHRRQGLTSFALSSGPTEERMTQSQAQLQQFRMTCVRVVTENGLDTAQKASPAPRSSGAHREGVKSCRTAPSSG
jgi:hypothetical protein